MAHTKGPWSFTRSKKKVEWLISSSAGKVIATVAARFHSFTHPMPEEEANANLIALAPDMLVALEAEEEFWDHYYTCPECTNATFCVDALALRLFALLMIHAVLSDARRLRME